MKRPRDELALIDAHKIEVDQLDAGQKAIVGPLEDTASSVAAELTDVVGDSDDDGGEISSREQDVRACPPSTHPSLPPTSPPPTPTHTHTVVSIRTGACSS